MHRCESEPYKTEPRPDKSQMTLYKWEPRPYKTESIQAQLGIQPTKAIKSEMESNKNIESETKPKSIDKLRIKVDMSEVDKLKQAIKACKSQAKPGKPKSQLTKSDKLDINKPEPPASMNEIKI